MSVDGAMWVAAAVLFGFAAWLQLRGERPWDPAAYFAACWTARSGGLPPLAGGAIEGWDGALDALPEELSPSVRLAHGIDWTGLEKPSAVAARARRLADTRVVWIGEASVAIDGVVVASIEIAGAPAGPDDEPAWADAAVAQLAGFLPEPQSRVVLAAGERAMDLLRLLRASPGLRDRVRAVLLVHAALEPAWVLTHVNHEELDVEVLREVPYLQLRAPGGEALPEPALPPSQRRCLAVVDLGETVRLDDAHLAGALADVLAAVG